MKSAATFSWQTLLSVSGGDVVSHHRPLEEVSIDTDTRTLARGCFFLPLKGQNFNGNDYIAKAYELGAEGAFIEKAYLEQFPDLKRFPNLIVVEDALMTYLKLAQFHRKRSQARIVAITGSSGKTTTKEMLFTMLSTVLGEGVQKSEKNFNNEVGVALTLLNITPETKVLILEMGMRGKGQIELLSLHAEPDIAIITNVGPAHIGLLGSIEAIAQAKCEIFKGMDVQQGLGIINGDDPLLVEEARRQWEGCLESFSLHEIDDIHTSAEGPLTFDYEGTTFLLGLPGSHNVMNALAGIKACEALGISLKHLGESLAHFEAGGGRWQKLPVEGAENLWVINDAYNANPVSLKMSLESFIMSPFVGLKKVAILGGMAELGEFSEQYHRGIGEWLNDQSGLDAVVTIGDETAPLYQAINPENIPVFQIGDNLEALSLIQTHWPRDAIILLKASRSFHLEEIPELLKKAQSHHALS